MNYKTIQKWGGFSLILGSILLTIYTIAFTFLISIPSMPNDFVQMVINPNWLWISGLAFIGVLFMIFGFTAVYSKIYAESGIVGFLGFVFIIIAYILQACKVTWELCIFPVIVKNEAAIFLLKDNILKYSLNFNYFRMMASLSILIGIIFFCIALFKASSFSKISSILIFIGAIIYGLSPVLASFNHYIGIAGIFIFAVGCFLLGQKLIKE
jgi:hypothetical protein